MNFRDNLLRLRAMHNLTQEQLAEKLGVSRQSVSKWEANKSYPEMDKLIALCEIFDCTLDELVQGDPTKRTACEPLGTDASANSDAGANSEANPQPVDAFESHEIVLVESESEPEADPDSIDEFGYDAHMRQFANSISTGVMMIILGTAVSMVFYGLAPIAENIFTALGVLCTLAGTILGVASIVPASLEHVAFVRQHPHIQDFYTEEDKIQARKSFAYELIGGLMLIFIGVVVIVLFSDTPLEEPVGVSVMLALVAVGARAIIHGSIVLGMTNIRDYNEGAAEVLKAHEIEDANLTQEQREEYLERHTTDKRIGGICGAIMIVATIVGLVTLFVPQYQTPLFWLAWPIGGLLCGLVSSLMKAFSRE